MRRCGWWGLVAVFAVMGCGVSPPSGSQVVVPHSDAASPAELLELYERANAAYEGGEIGTFRELTKELVEIWPGHPRLVYNLACGHALEGNRDAALDLLDRLVAMRVAFEPWDDEDLVSLRGMPRFDGLVDRFAEATAPTFVSEVAFRLDDPEFAPEDVAWDPVSGDLFLSSIRQRKVVRLDDQGRQTPFVGYPDIDMLAALSMAVDAEGRMLWLTTAAAPSMVDYRAEEHEGRSELLGFELDSGRLVARVTAPDDGERHELNDLAIEADGAVVVGDAPVGAIYRLRPGAGGFEIVVPAGAMFSPQGIVVLPGDGEILVADYSRGLCRITSDGGVRLLASAADFWLGGIDGLTLIGPHELIAVQNGMTPSRVVRIRLTEAFAGVAGVDLLDLAHPEHDQPTLGEKVGDDFLYVANSLWGAWDREGNLVEGRILTPPVILRIEL